MSKLDLSKNADYALLMTIKTKMLSQYPGFTLDPEKISKLDKEVHFPITNGKDALYRSYEAFAFERED